MSGPEGVGILSHDSLLRAAASAFPPKGISLPRAARTLLNQCGYAMVMDTGAGVYGDRGPGREALSSIPGTVGGLGESKWQEGGRYDDAGVGDPYGARGRVPERAIEISLEESDPLCRHRITIQLAGLVLPSFLGDGGDRE